LELGRVRASIFGQFDKQFGAIQVAIMVGGNVRNEIGRMFLANPVITDFEFHFFLLKKVN
jgi:hypothetical protein